MSEPPYISEELIELKAHQILQKRQLYGREGTSQSDWDEAKRYLEAHPWEVRQWNFFRRITLYWESTLIENCLESIEFLLEKLAFFTILGRLGQLAFIVAVVSFVFGENVRRNNEVFAAWTTITAANGQSGSGGRIEALEFLNSRPLKFPWIGWTEKGWYWDEGEEECKLKRLWGLRWEKQPLVGLSAPRAYLAGICLCGANLDGANLQEAYLGEINLQQANLEEANLQNAFLIEANLQSAYLKEANLQNANLARANLQDAILGEFSRDILLIISSRGANLQDTNLWGANLQNAKLFKANLQDANLNSANLQNADLREVNFKEVDLLSANLQGAILMDVRNLTSMQIKSACFWDRAIYKGRWERNNIVALEPDNSNYIEELKNDTASDSDRPIYCGSIPLFN